MQKGFEMTTPIEQQRAEFEEFYRNLYPSLCSWEPYTFALKYGDYNKLSVANAFYIYVSAHAPLLERLRVAEADAARDVLAERQRQISVEGWTPEHDDEHKNGDLAIAAACYVTNAATWLQRGTDDLRKRYADLSPGGRWPWPYKWWKPTNERRDLVKAGALILAEIERLDRATIQREQT